MRRNAYLLIAALCVLGGAWAVLSQTDGTEPAATPPAATETAPGEGEMQLVSAEILATLPEYGRERFLWPSAEDIAARQATGAAADTAKSAAAEWIRTVLQERWVPATLSEMLLALKGDVALPDLADPSRTARFDGVRVRYEIEGNRIQVVQVSSGMTVVIAPQGAEASPAVPREQHRQFVMDTVKLFLREAANIESYSVLLPSGAEGVTSGKSDWGAHPDASNQWYGTFRWWTDGKVLVFSCAKTKGCPSLPPLLIDWF